MIIQERTVRLRVWREPKGPYLMESMKEVLDKLEGEGYPRRKLWSQLPHGDYVELEYRL